MSVLPFLISKEAINDLNEIWHYTAHKWSVEQANRYYELIFEEIRYISKEPLSGRAINDIRPGYRVSKVKSHLIFYRPAIDRVEVVRILHQRMDIEGHLGIKE